MSQPNLVSVIILNWNGAAYLPACIKSLYHQSYKQIEIIIVDNGSTDDSVGVVKREYPELRLILNGENLGFAQGMNIGIAASEGEFILLLNEDTYLDRAFISYGVKEFKEDLRIGWVGGRVYEMKDGDLSKNLINGAFALKRRFQLMTLPDTNTRQTVLMVSPCAMLLRRSVLDDIIIGEGNWLDRLYFAYWEDTDLALRMLLRGWKCIFNPEMCVWHVVSGSVGGKRRLVDKPPIFRRMALHNRYRTIIKDIPASLLFVMLPLLIMVELVIIIYFASTSFSTLLCSIAALWDTLRSLPYLIRQRQFIQSRRKISVKEISSFIRGVI